MPKMTLKLDLSGEADLVYKFEHLIVSLLECGKNLGLVKYDMMAVHGDQVITKYGDPDDDIREVVTPRESRMAVKLTDEERKEIVRLKVEEQKSFSQISQALNVSKLAVFRTLKQAGLTKPAPSRVTDEEYRRIDELAASGNSLAKIAKEIGRSKAIVERYLKKKKTDGLVLRLVK